MGNNYKVTYNVDLVFCIDSTGSMDNIINLVKNNAINFYRDLMTTMEAKHKVINQLRIKIISFRDYIADGDNAMLNTDFFLLPEQSEEFAEVVNSIEADGGGDDPEDGLEALAYAIRSKWTTEGVKKRQVIVVWTDDATHDLGFGSAAPNYPTKMAKDFSELTAWWGDKTSGYMDYSAKRLILYAPDLPSWNLISETWENVLHFPSKAGEGLTEVTYEQIINTICNTIA